jgi:hypothetical protein
MECVPTAFASAGGTNQVSVSAREVAADEVLEMTMSKAIRLQDQNSTRTGLLHMLVVEAV